MRKWKLVDDKITQDLGVTVEAIDLFGTSLGFVTFTDLMESIICSIHSPRIEATHIGKLPTMSEH